MATRFTSLLTVLLLGLTGCAQMKVPGAEYFSSVKEHFDLSDNIPWGEGDYKAGMPSRVVAVWVDTVMYTTGEVPVRGFGGRLMFYTPKGEKPIKVEGDLVVYAFDEVGRDPRHVAPDKKYVFTAEQLAGHYSKGELGHSYSVWLPWDQAGGSQREISLIVRFIPKGGTVIVGDPTRHILPGAKIEETQLAGKPAAGTPAPVAAAAGATPMPVPAAMPAVAPVAPPAAQPMAAPPSGLQQTGHEWQNEATNGSNHDRNRKMQTTTIDMTSTFGRSTPNAVSQRPVAGEYGTQQSFPSIAPGVETTVHYGVSPRATAQQATAGAPAPGAAAPVVATPPSFPTTQPAGSGRSGLERTRTVGKPIERPVRERSPWQRQTSATPAQ